MSEKERRGLAACMACVSNSSTWCKRNDFFKKTVSQCVDNVKAGFFGDCSDNVFGGAPLESELDCTFNSASGEIILAVIIIFSFCLVLCSVGWGCKFRNILIQKFKSLEAQQQQARQTQLQPQQQMMQGQVLGVTPMGGLGQPGQPKYAGGGGYGQAAPISSAVAVAVPVQQPQYGEYGVATVPVPVMTPLPLV